MIHGGNVWQGNSPEEWLDFSANIRPEGPPEWVRAAMEKGMQSVRYYPDPSMSRARNALARYLGIDENCVLPTAGGISAIDLAVHLKVSGMLALGPCFGEYACRAAAMGIIVQQINLIDAQRHILSPAQAVEGKLFPGCALWLCNPLNPVGCGFSRQEVELLLEKVEKEHGYLLVDEAFIDYCPSNTVLGLLNKHPRLLITGSMTKILGIPGVRLGYLCAVPEILEQLKVYQRTWELNCFAESVLVELPEHRMEIRQDALENMTRREKLSNDLKSLNIDVYPSQANFLLTHFHFPVDKIQQELKKKRILVRDCRNFLGIDDGCHLRLAVKDEPANAQLLKALKEVLACWERR